ncbi:hypothetical protein F5X99DRAFT_368822 [Biscogniauxia marginata]|nr:hypothetical protein F5X99DRAFT_368822 [Biscogniauxia marginata]
MSSRQGLPNELLELIFDHLRLPPLRLGSELPDETFIENRAALRSLCRSSQLFREVARPLLYEKVILYIDEENLTEDGELLAGSKNLMLLVRTLTQRPGFRDFIKYIACPMLLQTSPWWHQDDRAELVSASWKYNKADFSDLLGDDWLVFRLAGLRTSDSAPQSSEDDVAGIAEKLLAVLLCLTPSLETLLMHTIERQRYRILNRTIAQALKHERLKDQTLPKLRTLQFQLPPRSVQVPELGRAECATVYECPVLLSLPSIRRIDTWHDEMSYIDDFSWVGKIEELDLVSQTSAETYCRLCEHAGNLRKLSIDIFNISTEFSGIFGTGTDLNAAIVHLAKTLQEFRVFTRYRDDYDSYLPPSARLTCLPKLKHLEILSVDRKVLFRNEAELQELGLADRLPPNLQVLNLYEDWHLLGPNPTDIELENNTPPSDEMYMIAFLDLEARRHERLPKLRKISLWPSNHCRRYSRLELRDNTLDQIRRLLEGASVEFSWLRRWPREFRWDDI